MPRRHPSVVAVLALAVVLAPLVALGSGTASGADRAADLKITAGDVSSTSGRVTGSFTVVNSGNKKASRTKSALRIDGVKVRSVRTGAIKAGRKKVVRFSVPVSGGKHVVMVCADSGARVDERKERNNCRKLGTVRLPSSSVPSAPFDYDAGVVFRVGEEPTEYWLHVPTNYDDKHRTPMRLVVLVHGCSMMARDTALQVKDQTTVTSSAGYILMSPGLGRDGECWDASTDAAPLVAAIADVKTHFNIDPKKVVIGGYSSGSTLVGQVAFNDAASYAGLFILPGRPFWSDDNRAELMSGAAWKLNVAWRAHKSDEYYPIATLRADRRAMLAADWPLAFSAVAGGHAYDQADLNYVFGRIGGWKAP